jgi:hypothetical protein
MRKDIVVRVDIVDWPGAKGVWFLLSTVDAYMKLYVERTSSDCRGARVEGRITPRVANVAHKPMRVKVQLIVGQESQCERDALPMCFQTHREEQT